MSGQPENQRYYASESLRTAQARLMELSQQLAVQRAQVEHYRASDLAAARQGAVIKDEEKDKVSWKEYLENVIKKRGSAWLPLYRACRELNG